jgi:hypothetical protein
MVLEKFGKVVRIPETQVEGNFFYPLVFILKDTLAFRNDQPV